MNLRVRDQAVVLVVDDDAANVRAATDALEAHDFEVVMARSGQTALRRAAFSQPDLILMDVQMPDMDGFETCRQLRANTATADIPVIFMTVASQPSDRLHGFAAGGVDYVTKPFEVDELLARVRAHITLRQLRTELQQQNQLLESHVQARTHELVAANQALREEVAERIAQQQEKEKLLEIVRDQAEQLRSLTAWLLESQREKQQAVADALREQSESKFAQLERDVQLMQRLLAESDQSRQSMARAGVSLGEATGILAELKAGVSAATARLSQPAHETELALLSLSGRERELLQLIAAGKSASEIASLMHVSASTVYTHRTNMLEKLNLSSMADLVRFALETRDYFSRAS